MKEFTSLAVDRPEDLVFGTAPHPVTTRRGLTIGGGTVYPELNFTLPTMEVGSATLERIVEMYRSIVDGACRRAVELGLDGLVVEFETLIEMTLDPSMAIRVSGVINEVLEKYCASEGLKTALRITPNDTRDKTRPPHMRSGELLEGMWETFRGCLAEGAELPSIESTGGKEIHDDALIACDIEQVIFALSIMGARDMAFLWDRIVEIADSAGTPAAGDTACGFGNTAMVLAEKRMIPRVFAAAVRAATAPRSLVAYERGAVGPGKDCGYENMYLKAITGFPMSMEGKAAACAHASPLGNIAAAACDLWSNESVQNLRLLGGMTPTISLEQLAYDCRLMNEATARGDARRLRDLLSAPDARLDPQALILSAESAVEIARAMVAEQGPYRRTRAAVRTALDMIEKARTEGRLRVAEMEVPWIDRLRDTVQGLPDTEDAFIERVLPLIAKSKFRAEDYGL